MKPEINKLKLPEEGLQLEQSSLNWLEKNEIYTKNKPVASIQPSTVSTNFKPPILSLKTTAQNNIDDFSFTSWKFKTMPITH